MEDTIWTINSADNNTKSRTLSEDYGSLIHWQFTQLILDQECRKPSFSLNFAFCVCVRVCRLWRFGAMNLQQVAKAWIKEAATSKSFIAGSGMANQGIEYTSLSQACVWKDLQDHGVLNENHFSSERLGFYLGVGKIGFGSIRSDSRLFWLGKN